MKIVERIDLSGVYVINQLHPKVKNVTIADTANGDNIKIKGRLNAVWINDKIAGLLSKNGWGLQIA